MKAIALYAALDLHSSHRVLGSMDQEGNSQGQVRFATEAESLRGQVRALRNIRRRADGYRGEQDEGARRHLTRTR